MHPDRRFAWEDREAMLAFVGEVAFCTIFVDGPAVMHAPVVVAPPDRLRFHVSRANRAATGVEGGHALLSCLGPDAYISPDWYGTPDQVPTWNYVAVEAEGPLRRLEPDELVALLDDLGAAHEARLAPKPAWTRDKLSPERFEGLLKAIVGFEMRILALRGTRKLGQNKREAERAGAAEGLAPFHPEMARLMRLSSPAFAGDEQVNRAPHGSALSGGQGGRLMDQPKAGGGDLSRKEAPPPHFVRSPSPRNRGED